MKLATFSTGDAPRVGIVNGEGIIDVVQHVPNAPRDMVGLISRWDDFKPRLTDIAQSKPDFALAEVHLHAPVTRPTKIMAIGLNYADHCAESNLEPPKVPTWFAKMPNSVNGPFDPIELPHVSEQLDHEAELVFIVGKRCRNVPAERAADAIFGYCVGNDVSVRDWQLRSSQWVIGKSFDTHAPFGPWITTRDEVDPHVLDIRLLVGGEVRQHSNTKNLIFNCYAQIEDLSKAMTLEPGDVVYTGTCSGVGYAMKPQRWLQQGEVVRVEIEKLGAIENKVQKAVG